ncbi:MAG TPA: DUF134 domain-containing protein [Methylomusa anaerophila]|uniref:UPF0251 protein MAMMFC1_00280 n=1 Tax=Methylomusa anaerophila TaxID=1930071 RepID=A0A348AEZ9_9FIRM|nr:DUF134 domain-containing protein [Methylomusa anaerophila]BBB89647.1 hypothetical protein MAMMFC1_00280 [Methylomusa anaerophila]HML89577.1 DUF134 domain-containing protein [Methylomusa anaerophila]
MSRPFKEKTVRLLPPISDFKPAGIPMRQMETVILTIDEMEAIRLADVEKLSQAAAAEQMGVSGSTFNRVLMRAHQKVGIALWQGKALRIEGGNFRVSHSCHNKLRHFICQNCGNEWAIPYGNGQRGSDLICPLCSSADVMRKE